MKYLLIILLLSGCTVNKYYCAHQKPGEIKCDKVHIPETPFGLYPKWGDRMPFHIKGIRIDTPCCYAHFIPSLLIPEQQITYFSDSVNTEIISVDSLMIDKSKYILTPSESQGETAIGVIAFLKNKKSDSKQKKNYAEQVDPQFYLPPENLRWPSYPTPQLFKWGHEPLKGTSIDSACCYVPFMPSVLIPEKKITYFASDSVTAEIISVDSLMKKKKVTSDSVRRIKNIKLQ